jgi:hypothetical protein
VSASYDDSLRLKAAVEFGSENMYTIKNGGLGRTLCIDAGTRAHARKIRIAAPSFWEGLYVMVLYTTNNENEKEEEVDYLYDPTLT